MPQINVVIDPGHGGSERIGDSSPNNAKGPNGTLEKNVTLEIGILATVFLRAMSHNVLLTRDTDINIGLLDRAKLAQDNQVEAFVSIHFNGNDDPSIQGTETFVHPSISSEHRLLAQSVQQRILSITGYRNRGIKEENFVVLRPENLDVNTAACLVEISFMTDPADEERLQDKKYLEDLGSAIAKAINDYAQRSSGV